MQHPLLKGSLTGALLFCTCTIFGQVDPEATGYYLDVLRFSKTQFGGSSRFQGIAGAGTAIGADMGALSSNPAGIAVYRKSEASVTGAFGAALTQSEYLGEPLNDNRINMNIANIGFVSSNMSNNTSGWIGGNWGFSFNRTNNFQNRFSYDGVNTGDNLGDYFVDRTNGIPESVLQNEISNNGDPTTLESLAWHSFLIEASPPGGDQYFTFYEGEPVRQQETVINKGAQYSWDLSYGGNIGNKFFFGFSASLQTFRYIEERIFREIAEDDQAVFNSVEFRDNYKSNGIGFNAKAGFIYRLNDIIRFGGSIHSPTFYRVNDEFGGSMTVNYNNDPFFGGGPSTYEQTLNPFEFTWNLTTPMRANGGVAIFAGKNGFLSADLEFVPYGMANVSDPEDFATFTGDNKTINNLYQSTFNLRVGGEFRYESFRLRGGFASYGDPIRNVEEANDIDRRRLFFTGGAGIRKADNFFDFSVVYSKENSAYVPYAWENVSAPTADIRNGFLNFMFTFGTIF